MSKGERNLWQRVQEQILQSARDFYGNSLGQLKGQLQGDRTQLQDLAEELPEGGPQAQVRDMVESYSKIEEPLDRSAQDLGMKDAGNEAARQVQEEESRGESGWAAQGAPDAAGGAIGRVMGAGGQVAGQAGQMIEGAQEALGQALDRVGQVAEHLPGAQLLSRTTNEVGQTVQRAVDGSGAIIEITLDESSNLVDQKPVVRLADLPVEEEYQNEEGRTIRIVKEGSGTLIEVKLGEGGSILDLQVLS